MPDETKKNENGEAGSTSTSTNNTETPNPITNNTIESTIIATIKIPSFWTNRPELWFLHVETQFRMKNITTSSTKYDYTVSALQPETMEIVADILLNPPATNKYENLKNTLLSRSRDTEERRFDALFNKMELGDAKPSELYRQMESLAQGNSLVNNSLLRKLWLNKLPGSIQACVIAIEGSHSDTEIFSIADRIHDSALTTKVYALGVNNGNSRTESLQQTVENLQNRLNNLELRNSRNNIANNANPQHGYRRRSFNKNQSNVQQRNRSFSRHRSNSQSSNSFTRLPQSSNQCWYHRKFGANAKKCTLPCTKANENKDSKN